ncbi:MAG TPA: hypothetical protein VHG11_00115 [Pseudorhizobium sp.]|nr:hypothetical protein [Pseudorhizobium sp.]
MTEASMEDTTTVETGSGKLARLEKAFRITGALSVLLVGFSLIYHIVSTG